MKKSFTLIEILVVTTIIALLAAAAAVSYSSISKSSRDARRKADLEQIRAALEMYRSNNADSQYPSAGTCTILQATITPYIGSMPTDPKTSYTYYCNSSASDYTVASYLETGSVSCSGYPSCGTGITCNYCLGPYGKK